MGNPNAAASADPDGDGNEQLETSFLAGTNPTNGCLGTKTDFRRR